MKQFFYLSIKAVLVALTLLGTQSAIAANYTFVADGIYYRINSDSTTLSVNYGDNGYTGDVTVPATVEYNNKTYRVTTIDNSAFSWCYELTGLHLPSTITTIGTEILANSNNAVSLTIDSENPKYDCRDNCNAIIETRTNRLVVGSVATVIPNTVTTIGEYAFSHLAIPEVNLPSSVTVLEHCAFYWCDSITEVILPNTVESLGFCAFDACSNLATVFIPASVQYIDYGVFADSKVLSSITVDPQNPYYDSRNNCNAIIKTSTNELITGCQNTIIPDDVEIIGEDAFYNCGLRNITIPNSVRVIGSNAFRYDYLTDIEIPGSVTEIKSSTFYGCNNLENVILNEGLEKIGREAFRDCYFRLTRMDFPNSLRWIDSDAFRSCWKLQELNLGTGIQYVFDAFSGCKQLRSIRCLAIQPPYFTSGLDSICYADAIVRVPYQSVEAYKETSGWKKFAHILGLYSGAVFEVDGIYYYATSDSTASVTSMVDEGCYYSGDIVIPETVTFQDVTFTVDGIRENAFDGSFELLSVLIPNTVTTIGAEAFQGCSSLASVTIGSGVTAIGAKAFNYCNALASVTCMPQEPPVMENMNCFTINCYRNAELKVLRTSMESYQAADFWNRFNHIVGFGSAGPGDVDGDGKIGVSDVTSLIDLLLAGEEAPDAADVDGDGVVTISDITILIDMVLGGI